MSERTLWLDELLLEGEPSDVWAIWSEAEQCYVSADDLALAGAIEVLWYFPDLRRCFAASLLWLYGSEARGVRDFSAEQVRAALRATGL